MAENRKELPMKEFLKSMEIAIKAKEVDYLKVLQRLDTLGMDTSKYRDNYDASPACDVPCNREIRQAATEVTETSRPIDPNELPPEPQLEDYGISKETLLLFRMKELGMELPNPPTFKQALLSPSPSLFFSGQLSKQQQQQHLQSTPAICKEPYLLTQTHIDGQVGMACTPELFAPVQPRFMKSRIPMPSPRRTSGKSTSEYGKIPIHNSPKAIKELGVTEVSSLFTSPVTPTLSTEYSFIKPSRLEKNSVTAATTTAIATRNTNNISPVEPILKTIPAQCKKVGQSPVCHELSSSLEWRKLK